MNLEERIEEGGFYYIHSIKEDFARRSLIIELIKAPEEMSAARRLLIFEDIEDYSAEVDADSVIEKADDGVIDSLIAVGEYVYEDKLMYEVMMEDRVFNLHTKTKPRIENT